MSVEPFDPSAEPQSLTQGDIQTLLDASGRLDQAAFGLSDHEVVRLARLVRADGADWSDAAAELSDAQLEALIRLLVLAEGALPGWDSGAKSPVIVLARALKARSGWPEELTHWIKSHSENRFLPHGSLLDRL